MAAAVNDKSAAVETMAAEWPMLEALMAGTRAMRTAGEKLMPRFTLEHPEDYKARLSVATLFPAFRRTVSVMTGKPFAKPLNLSDDTPAQIKDWSTDIDNEGVNLHAFAAEMFAEGLAYGLAGILVDAPKALETGARPPSRAEQARAKVRPYFVRVRHGQILGWRSEVVNGQQMLTQLRLLECTTEADGSFGEKQVVRVRVLTIGAWALYEESAEVGTDGKKVWVLKDEGQTGLSVINFVPIYGTRLGFMEGVSPLLDLAHLNVKDDSVMYARKRLVALIGGDEKKPLVSSSSAVIYLPIGGDVKIAQGAAENVEVGQKSLEALEDQMIQAGAELLVKKPGDRSATEAAGDQEANKSDLQRIAESFADALDQALYLMAQFAKLGDTGGNVTLFSDYGASSLGSASGQLVISMQQGGLISKGTAIAELQRRGELSADLVAEEELERVEAEGPGLGTITGDGLDEPDPAGVDQ